MPRRPIERHAGSLDPEDARRSPPLDGPASQQPASTARPSSKPGLSPTGLNPVILQPRATDRHSCRACIAQEIFKLNFRIRQRSCRGPRDMNARHRRRRLCQWSARRKARPTPPLTLPGLTAERPSPRWGPDASLLRGPDEPSDRRKAAPGPEDQERIHPRRGGGEAGRTATRRPLHGITVYVVWSANPFWVGLRGCRAVADDSGDLRPRMAYARQ